MRRMDETPSLLPSRALPRRSGILCDDDDGDDDDSLDLRVTMGSGGGGGQGGTKIRTG